MPHSDALQYFDAVPNSWGLSPDHSYPSPIIDIGAGRSRALDAFHQYQNL